MINLHQLAGVTKQALYKYNIMQQRKSLIVSTIFEAADEVRVDHPKMGCRTMYDLIQPTDLGRDRLEQLLLRNGYRVRYKPNYIRTTYSTSNYHPNLIEGLELTGINQVWQSDITYFYLNGNFYFLTFIIDVYSRRIVGYAASNNLRAEANISALKMALGLRKGADLSKLIHHSDRGSQYVDKEYIRILDEHEIQKSMCKEAWENPFAERINGVIKNQYLKGWVINNYHHLKQQLKRAVNNYNNTKPHGSLPKRLTPVNLEEKLVNCSTSIKLKVKLYAGNKSD